MSEGTAKTRSMADIERQITLLVGTWIGLYMQPEDGESEYVDAKAETIRCQIQALLWAISPGLSWSAAGQAATDMIEECAEEAES